MPSTTLPELTRYDGPWTTRHARHLLERAGFGLPVERVAEIEKLGCSQAVEQFIEASWKPDGTTEPNWLPEALNNEDMRERLSVLNDEEERRKARQLFDRANREAVIQLVLWWMKRMYESPAVLREKMTLFWHGHFAVSAEKVKQARLNYQLNTMLRQGALGSFRGLVEKVAKSPAMIRYLDNDRNVKGDPNENFARELMELFTLGIGNYTEQDIKESARAFTGWAFNGENFQFRRRRHDDSSKEFMGQRGKFGGEDIIRIILKNPQCARFLSRKIWMFFAEVEPTQRTAEVLAERFRGTDYDVTDLLRTILTSAEFYGSNVVGAQIKSPVHFIIGLHGHLETSTPRQNMIPQALRLLGQVPFYPPNVKGWDYGRAWINSNTLLLRANMANYLVNGIVPDMSEGRGRRNRKNDEQKKSDAIQTMADDRRDLLPDTPMKDMAMDESIDAPAPKTSKSKPPLDLAAFLADLGANSPESLIERACARFLSVPISDGQRTQLYEMVRSVASIGEPKKLSKSDEAKVRGLLHQLLTTAEYQLC